MWMRSVVKAQPAANAAPRIGVASRHIGAAYTNRVVSLSNLERADDAIQTIRRRERAAPPAFLWTMRLLAA